MAILEKEFLSYDGLEAYDGLIKEYIKESGDSNVDGVKESLKQLENSLNAAIANEAQTREEDISRLNDAVEAVKELVGDDKVQDAINAAIAKIVDGAPDAFDTLKEISDWIAEHGEGANALIKTVAELSNKVDAVDKKADDVYNAFKPIDIADIKALFLKGIEVDEGQTVSEAIDSLQDNQKLILTQNVDEPLSISKDAVIEAKGVTFNEQVSVSKGAKVSIIGAEFAKPVVVE